MAEIAKKHQDQLKRIKKNIERSCMAAKENNDRYHEFRKFVFKTSLSSGDVSSLQTLGKPIIEFNILNAYISRNCGEFSKQEPSISVRTESGAQVDPRMIEVIEGHMRHIMTDAKKRNTQYNVYKDTLTGGFSNVKVWTEYANERSFDQVIKYARTYEPTLTGYDPMAREPDKSDAAYSFEIFPKSKEEFQTLYPDVDISELSFTREVDGFAWSYENEKEDVVIMCDYYEKKKKRKQIVRITGNKTITMDEYKALLSKWESAGYTEQPPAIIGEPRWSEFQTICRYQLIGSQVLEYTETDFKYLPHVFVDGDSIIIQEDSNSTYKQFTKPYVYHAKGIQRLKNLSGQCLADDLENMVQHKFKVAKESIPQEQDYQEAYTNVQKANTLVYNQFDPDNPDRQLNPPQEIARVPSPPEVTNTFSITDQTTQTILGAYDASLGINDNQLSGIAIVEGATQSNAAAMPYIVSYMQSLTQVAQIILDLIPKYYVTPRTIPIMGKDGKRTFQRINDKQDPNSINLDYDSNDLQVSVEAGVNFAIAKNKALQQMIALMQASPLFAEFINSEGLEVLLGNMEFRGVDVVMEKVDEWQKKMEQAKQNQPNPQMMAAQAKIAEVKQKGQIAQGQLQVDMAKTQADLAKVAADLQMSRDENMRENIRARTDHAFKIHDNVMQARDMKHRHAKETIETMHNIHQAQQQNQLAQQQGDNNV